MQQKTSWLKHTCSITHTPVKEGGDENESLVDLITQLLSPSEDSIPVKHPVAIPLMYDISLISSGVAELR